MRRGNSATFGPSDRCATTLAIAVAACQLVGCQVSVPVQVGADSGFSDRDAGTGTDDGGTGTDAIPTTIDADAAIVAGSTMCAEVRNGSNTAVAGFCEQGHLGQSCIGLTTGCTDDNSTATYRAGESGLARYPWYQAAILWAREQGNPTVELSPGTLQVTADSAIPAAGFGKVGLLVPSNVQLRGSSSLAEPTVLINTDSNPSPGNSPPANRVYAMILLSEDLYQVPEGHDHSVDMTRHSISNASVSYLQVSGVNQPPNDCSSFSYTMESITDTDAYTPPAPTIYDRSQIQAYFGILVDRAVGSEGPVDVHHVVVAHVETGIQLGWASFGLKADPSCQTVACVRLSYVEPVNGQCAQGVLRHLDVVGGDRCIVDWTAPSCSRNYCPMGRFLYQGAADRWGAVHHSSFCDADQGISAAYASNVDIYDNLVLGIRPTPNGFTDAGIWTYTNANVYYNYVTQGDFSFAAEGSNFPNMDSESWKTVTGYYPTDPGITGDDYQILGQYLVAEANEFFLETDPYGAFGNNVRISYNKFLDYSHGGVGLVRQNYTWVGANIITGLGAASLRGVLLLDSINTFVYGNTISDVATGVWVYGFPGVGSQLGSVANSCHQYYDISNDTWSSWPNTFANVGTLWEIGSGASCTH